MKTATLAMSTAVLICGLIAGRAPLHAQPASGPIGPIVVEGDDKPWNKGVPIATREAARQIFLEGNRLFKVPLFAQAAEQYVAALSKWKHPAFHFNLAIAQLNLRQDLAARDNLEQALAYGPEPLGQEQFQEAKKQLADVQRHLGRIRVGCPTEGAEVTLDGTTLFTGPGSHEVWVDATQHEIAAKKRGYVSQARHLTVAAGALQTVELTLHKLVEDRPWATWKPWVVVGAGVAIAAAAGATHAVAARGFSQFDDHFRSLACSTSGCSDAEIGASWNARLDRARLEQKIAVGGYVAGGAILAAGAVLLYLNRPRLANEADTSSSATDIAIVPAAAPGMVGVLVTVSR